MRPPTSASRGRAVARALRAFGVAPANDDARGEQAARAAATFPPVAAELAAQALHVFESVLCRCPRLRLDLPGPPRPKGRARTFVEGGRVRTRTPTETKVHEAHVRDLARLRVLASRPRWPLGGYPGARYVVASEFVLVDDAGDYDNLTKTVDALNGVVWPDDRLVCLGLPVKRVAGPGEHPRSTLTIWALGPGQPDPKETP